MIRTDRSRLACGLAALAGGAALAGCSGTTPAPATPTVPPPTEVAAAEPPALEFVSDDIRLAAGSCTQLHWRAVGALRTYIDGRGAAATGTREVCPLETTTYTLTAALPDGSEANRTLAVQVEAPATGPTRPAAPVAPPRVVTSAPAVTATATPAPTEAVSVEFYPDNNAYEIGAEDACTAVNWRTAGVTGVQLEREGMGRKDVGASGREEVCFGERQVKFYLYFKLADGREDRREVAIRRKS
jgi:hypothetical protein